LGILYNTFRPQPYNSNLKEETTTVNAGLDYGFLIIELLVLLICIKEPPKIYYCTRKTHLSSGSQTMTIIMSEQENKGIEIAANVIQFVQMI
jgi:iron complex outermembrane receptor protein